MSNPNSDDPKAYKEDIVEANCAAGGEDESPTICDTSTPSSSEHPVPVSISEAVEKFLSAMPQRILAVLDVAESEPFQDLASVDGTGAADAETSDRVAKVRTSLQHI